MVSIDASLKEKVFWSKMVFLGFSASYVYKFVDVDEGQTGGSFLVLAQVEVGRSPLALLFIRIMDVLTMVDKAEAAGVFEPLDRWGVRHRLSL